MNANFYKMKELRNGIVHASDTGCGDDSLTFCGLDCLNTFETQAEADKAVANGEVEIDDDLCPPHVKTKETITCSRCIAIARHVFANAAEFRKAIRKEDKEGGKDYDA